MKKIMSVLWAMLILLCAAFPAFGAQTSAVFAEDVLLIPGSEATIPVLIEDNAGLMGFKITVEYPVDKIKITSVTKGEVTGKGNFNTNFGIHDGKFDVLWNHVEEVQSDGTLFVLTARAVADFTDPVEIKLTFSQGDTFNEAYEDVVLNCRSIQVGLLAADASSPESGAPWATVSLSGAVWIICSPSRSHWMALPATKMLPSRAYSTRPPMPQAMVVSIP